MYVKVSSGYAHPANQVLLQREHGVRARGGIRFSWSPAYVPKRAFIGAVGACVALEITVIIKSTISFRLLANRTTLGGTGLHGFTATAL